MELKLNKQEQELVNQLQIGTENEVIENRFGGDSIELEPTAVALYDFIMGCEAMGKFDLMYMGINIFRKNWVDAYYILLD